MAKFFIGANPTTEKDAMVKVDGVSLTLTGAARVLYDDSLSKRDLVNTIRRIADRIEEKFYESANIVAPSAPTIGTATAGVGAVSVTFTPPASTGGSPITGYQVTLSTGQINTGASSPISVTAPAGVAVTAVVRAANIVGYGPPSASSNSVTPT